MLSLLLNKNPRLSLGVVSHRLLWSLVVWQKGADEVRRQQDRWVDIQMNHLLTGMSDVCRAGWMDGWINHSTAVNAMCNLT